MGYDDGFYYGQCKLICLAESAADNGKTVSVSNGDRSWSGTVANQKCEFLVPNRTQYAVELIDGDDTDWAGTIEAGYGECILVHLADGYEAIVEKKKLTLDEIAASVGSVADYVPDADAVKTLNTNLVANNTPFRFGYDSVKGKYGYILNQGGADTVIPFKENPSLYDDDYYAGNRPSSNTVTVTLEKGTYIITLAFHGHTKDSQTQTLSNCNVIEQLSMIENSSLKGSLTEIQLLVEATEDNATFSSNLNCSATTSYWLLHYITAIKIG